MGNPATDYVPKIETSDERARPELLKGWAAIATLDEVADAYGLGVLYSPENERRMIAADLERRMRSLSADLKLFLTVKP